MYCHSCGEEIADGSKYCSECGAEQSITNSSTTETVSEHTTEISETIQSESVKYTDQYPLWVWIGSAILSVITFPVGLVIPFYFFIKAQAGNGKEQSDAQALAVILFGIFGIIGVEVYNRLSPKQRKYTLYVIVGLFALLLGISVLVGVLASL